MHAPNCFNALKTNFAFKPCREVDSLAPSKDHPLQELADSARFPQSLRAYQADFLGGLATFIGLYRPVEIFLKKKLPDGNRIVDLASGSGMAALRVLKYKNIDLVLSDKFPDAMQVSFINRRYDASYLTESYDITANDLPKGSHYTLFNGLHHFSEDEIAGILQSVKTANAHIYFFEPVSPSPASFFKVAFATLILPFFIVPFIRPFRWDRIIYTYLLPLGVITTFWDGVISVIKSYSTHDLVKMRSAFAKRGISINTGVLRGRFVDITYLEL